MVSSLSVKLALEYGEVIVDYCILPDYDDMLETYSDHLVTMAEEQNNM